MVLISAWVMEDLRADDDDDDDEVAEGDSRQPLVAMDWEDERDADAIREVENSSKKRQKCACGPEHSDMHTSYTVCSPSEGLPGIGPLAAKLSIDSHRQILSPV